MASFRTIINNINKRLHPWPFMIHRHICIWEKYFQLRSLMPNGTNHYKYPHLINWIDQLTQFKLHHIFCLLPCYHLRKLTVDSLKNWMGNYLEKSKHDVFVNGFLLRIKVEPCHRCIIFKSTKQFLRFFKKSQIFLRCTPYNVR